jgi:Domain of unknown function (DUF4440)
MNRVLRSAAAGLAVVTVVAGLGVVTTVGTTASAWADTCTETSANLPLPVEIGPCADVLAQEARWLKAITDGDVATVEQVLGPTFKHVNAEAQFLDRAAEIASTEKLPFTMNPSEQMIDVAGDTAVIHGVNTLTQDGKVVATERFTDVFALMNGNWMALSAQETKI